MKEILTLNNFQKFLKQLEIDLSEVAILAETNYDKFGDIVSDAAKKVSEYFDLPSYIDPAEVMFEATVGDMSAIPFLPETDSSSSQAPEKPNKNIIVNTSHLDTKLWSKSPEVFSKLSNIVEELESMPEQEAEALLDLLQQTPKEFPLRGGNICSPKKYIANSPYSLPKGITAVELRINSADKAQYRIYGILKNNVIYLLKAYTKNSGQRDADKDFDKFMDFANKFIKDNKLAENLLYYNKEILKKESFIMCEDYMTDNVFGYLDLMDRAQHNKDYNSGWNDYCCGKLLESAQQSEDYKKGAEAAMQEEKIEEARQFLKDNRETILRDLKDRLAKM